MWDTYRRNSKGWSQDPIAIVHPRIHLGSADDVNLFTFAMNGYTHVINCATEQDGARWFKYEWSDRYTCLNAEDTEEFDITSVYPKFEQSMNRYLADPHCNVVFVHCQCGINRSAFLLLMYVCKKFHYGLENAIKHIASQRPCCFTNPAFRKQVEEYIKKLE